ncbi:MAG: restriction endonuclease subunit S [Burkholderiales bacterium]
MSGLPRGWAQARISDILFIRNGYAFKSTYFCDDGVPLIRQSELKGNLVDLSESVCLPESFLEDHSDYLITKGDVLIGMSGSLGKVSLYLSDRPALQNQRTGLLIVDELAADKTFALYALKYVEPQILKQGKGVAVQNVSTSQIESCGLLLPPRAEQTRIVAKLEELLSDLDAGVAELKAAQKKLAQYRQSLLKAAVEGALTAEWRKQHPATESGAQLLARILQERRARWEAKQLAKFAEQGKTPPKDWQKKYPEPVQPDTTDLPALPEGWVWATIDQLAAIGTGVTPLKSKSQYYVGGDIPWVTSGALNNETVTEAIDYVTPIALEECRLELYPAGALLVAMYGEGKTRGKCSELAIPATINQAIAALVLEDTAIGCKPYVKLFLLKSYDDMRNQASGGVQPNLNLQIVRSIAIPIPPVNEQQAITGIVSTQLEAVKEQREAIDQSLKQSTAQRQNILRAAFAGQLVPQDPNDEPANVLLERIRAERAQRAATVKPRKRQPKEPG